MWIHDQRGPSRRAVLRTGVAAVAAIATGLAVAGCDSPSDDPKPAPPPDPLSPLLTGTVELIARYDAAIAARPELATRLTPIRQAHQAHATELASLIGTPAPGSPTPGTPPATAPTAASGVLAALRAAESAARRTAATACLAAPADRAAILGSIAAARASHAEALR